MCASARSLSANAITISLRSRIESWSASTTMRTRRWAPLHLSAIHRVIGRNGKLRNTTASKSTSARHCASMTTKSFPAMDNNGTSKSKSQRKGPDRRLTNARAPNRTPDASTPREPSPRTLRLPGAVSWLKECDLTGFFAEWSNVPITVIGIANTRLRGYRLPGPDARRSVSRRLPVSASSTASLGAHFACNGGTDSAFSALANLVSR